MSIIPAKETERNRDEPDGLNPVCVPPANRPCDSEESLPLRLLRRRMRVKLCLRCPYTPPDLADHYDPEGVLHVCAKCDGRQEAGTNQPHKAHRRQKCATPPSIHGMAQPNVAQSAAESSASSDTTPGEPPSVQRSALTASRHARMATADGYVAFTPPDNGYGETPVEFFRSKELAQ